MRILSKKELGAALGKFFENSEWLILMKTTTKTSVMN